jgi:ATP-binding cassette, subfamily B (MDR/TAP), member 1
MPYENDENRHPTPSKGLRIAIPPPIAHSQHRRRSPPIVDTPIDNRSYTTHSYDIPQNTTKPDSPRIPSVSPSETRVQHDSEKWVSLFKYTTKSHSPFLIFSILCSIIVGIVTPLQYYLLGRLFTSFAQFGAGAQSENGFKEDLARYNIYYVLLGGLLWLFSSSMFAGWVLFGELQGRSARERLFNGLVNRPIDWYDQRQDGIGALMTKLQG